MPEVTGVDLEAAIGTLLGYFLYVALALAVIFLMYSAVALARGDRRGPAYLLSSVLAIIFIFTFNQIFSAATSGVSFEDTAMSLVAHAIIAVLLISGVIYLAVGRTNEAGWSFVSAFLAIIFLLMIPAVTNLLGSGEIPMDFGTCKITMDSMYTSRDPPQISSKISHSRGRVPENYQLVVMSEGITLFSGTIAAQGPTTMATIPLESKPKDSVVIVAISTSPICSAYDTLPPLEMDLISWIISPILQGLQEALKFFGDLVNLPSIDYLFTNPYLDLEDQRIKRMYDVIVAASMTFFGVFFVINLAASTLQRTPHEAVIDSVKSAVVVLFVILIGPYLYNLLIGLTNLASIKILFEAGGKDYGFDILLGIAALLGAVFGLGLLAGSISHFVGNFTAVIVVLVLLTNIFVYVRYVLVLAMGLMLPLLAVLSLVPPFRHSIAVHLVTIALITILLAPLTALIMLLLGYFLGPFSVFAPIISFTSLPVLYSIARGTPSLELTRGIVGALRGGIVPAGQLGAVAGAAGAMGAMVGPSVGSSQNTESRTYVAGGGNPSPQTHTSSPGTGASTQASTSTSQTTPTQDRPSTGGGTDGQASSEEFAGPAPTQTSRGIRYYEHRALEVARKYYRKVSPYFASALDITNHPRPTVGEYKLHRLHQMKLLEQLQRNGHIPQQTKTPIPASSQTKQKQTKTRTEQKQTETPISASSQAEQKQSQAEQKQTETESQNPEGD